MKSTVISISLPQKSLHTSSKMVKRVKQWTIYKLENNKFVEIKKSELKPVCAKSLQLYPTLCNPLYCSPPGSSVHGILQVRILKWVPCPTPGDLPNPGIETESFTSPALAGEFFTTRATWEALMETHSFFNILVDANVFCNSDSQAFASSHIFLCLFC